MKPLSLILFILTVSFTFGVPQQLDHIANEIKAAFSKSDSDALSELLNNTIDLTLPDIEGSFSRSQAHLIIKEFFADHPAVSFTINHEGSSNKGSQYMIGTYKTKSSVFRVYILIKDISGKMLIQQLQIEPD